RSGNPIEGRTGAETALFDGQSRRLPAAEQMHPTIDLVAVRVAETPQRPPAILLLDTTVQDVSLARWSRPASPDDSQATAGMTGASQALAIDVPKAFFNPKGSVVTLLDQSGLKLAGAVYPRASDQPPGWSKVT